MITIETLEQMSEEQLISLISHLAFDEWNVDDEICKQNMEKIRELIIKWRNQ